MRRPGAGPTANWRFFSTAAARRRRRDGALRRRRSCRGRRRADRARRGQSRLMRDGDNGIAPLHLLKMAVGVGDIDELRRFRAARLKERGGSWIYTRNHPRRTAEVLAGGSIYWVIRGQIRVRQLVTGFRSERD